MQRHHYQAYATATQTVARTKQIVMLYDGVIRYVQQAKDAIREKRIEDRYHLLVKASDIIAGLQACLDFENGGEIARILFNFYSSVDGRIFSIHRDNSLQTCDEVIAELKQMRDVWHEIDQTMTDRGEAVSGQAPAPAQAASDAGDAAGNVTLSA